MSYRKGVQYFFFIIAIFLSSRALGQVEDFGLWTTISLEKNFTKRFSVGLDQEVRLKENVTQLDQTFTNLGVNYKLFKFLKLSGTYRFTQKYMLDESISFRHRFFFDITLRHKFNPIIVIFRSRIQTQVRANESGPGSLFEDMNRNKLQLKLDLDKRYQPYVAAEMYYQLRDPKNAENRYNFNNMRYQAGVDYEINRVHKIGAYFLHQREMNVAREPFYDYVIGLEYLISF